MSEEIKDILNEFKIVIDYNEIQNIYRTADLDYNDAKLLLDYITNLQQKVEQLEKENKELKYNCSCSFHDAEELNQKLMEIIDERNDLDTKLIQLENIRKEAIKLIEEDILGKKIENVNWDYDECYYSDMPVERVKPLLNILNKGDNKE